MNYETIHEVELELNTICQSFCPVCIRYVVGAGKNNDDVLYKNPGIEFNQVVDFEYIEKLFSSPLINNRFLYINMIGTAGEPVAHPRFIEIVNKIIELHPHAIFNIHTNGGLRNEQFFRDLAKALNKCEEYRVCFSLDGIDQETNGIYRIGVDWDKAIRNMKAFIDAGGYATWQFIIFDHNKHLEETAKQMAQDMGCREFESRENVAPDGIEVGFTAAKNRIDMKTPARIRLKPKGWRPPLPDYDHIDDQCFSKKGVFLAPDGKIWPCCMMPSIKSDRSMINIWNEAMLDGKYGEDWNSLKYTSFDEIMKHPWWEQLRRWVSMEEKPCDLCIKECGATSSHRRNSDINEIKTQF